MDRRRAGGAGAVVLATALSVAGCGGEAGGKLVIEGTPPATPYSGPLRVPFKDADADDNESPKALLAESGAAGRALECDGDIYSGGGGDRWSRGDGGSTPEGGLKAYFDIEQPDVPQEGYRVEREARDRVLYSLDVRGRTKVAVIVAKDQPHRPGWGPEASASCDPAELPRSFTDRQSYEIWTEEDGDRVPVSLLSSSEGSAHCDWQSAHFLGMGRGSSSRLYARDPGGVLPPSMLTSRYDGDAPLPPDAKDTGYRLNDWRLWLAADRSKAYVRTPRGVEAWPTVRRGMGCE
ncbi:hypothetical protein ACH4TX_30615 [Streptomyces sp. NPDC021098]|uniref:hypothetical protein n=1 Tax=unclassified Streptomyces TaxID=2593676 RepID=UPI00379C7C9A